MLFQVQALCLPGFAFYQTKAKMQIFAYFFFTFIALTIFLIFFPTPTRSTSPQSFATLLLILYPQQLYLAVNFTSSYCYLKASSFYQPPATFTRSSTQLLTIAPFLRANAVQLLLFGVSAVV